MGRARLNMRRLESSSNRQVTYCKRKSGLLKKAKEISVLCDIDILLLMFSPSGKPTLFQGQRSNFDEIIAKFAQLTPQERAKRKMESLEALRKTFKKVDHDIGVQEFLDASDPSVEELQSQVKVLQSRLTGVEKRLSWWSNPDEITTAEDLAQMECALRDLLNAVHVQKLQNPMHMQFFTGSEQEGDSLPLHPAYKSQHMAFPEASNFIPQGDTDYSRNTSVAKCSHVLDRGKELELDQASQATSAILEASMLDDLTSIASLRQQLREQYSYNPYDDNLNLLESTRLYPQSEVNVKGFSMDYENFNLPVDSVKNPWDSAAGASADPVLNEKSYWQQGDSSW